MHLVSVIFIKVKQFSKPIPIMYYLLPRLHMLRTFRCAAAGSVCAAPFPYNRGNVVCNAQIKTMALAGIPLTLNAHFDFAH